MNRLLLVSTIAAALAAASATAIGQTAAPPVAADAVAALQKVCLPVLRGGDLKSSAQAAGFAMQDGQWTLTIDKDTSIALNPPDSANPHVCGASISAPFAAAPALKQAIDRWAKSQTPPLVAERMAPPAGGADAWTSSAWGRSGESVTLAQEPSSSPTAVTQSNLLVTLGAS